MVTRQNTTQDQDKPSKRFSLVGNREGRGATLIYNDTTTERDQHFYNMYSETLENPETKETYKALIKRPGLAIHLTLAEPATPRGLYFWFGAFWVVYGNNVYWLFGTTLILVFTFTNTSTTRVGFADYFDGTNRYLFVCDGVEGYYVNVSFVATKITDAQFPTPHTPTPVAMDGYLFLPKGHFIYNSDLNNIASWSSQLIATELYPDTIVRIVKHFNQVVAFGEYSTEFFYDAANVNTSPLSRVEGNSHQFGTPSTWGVVSVEEFIFLPATSLNGGVSIFMFSGFNVKKISTPYIDKYLTRVGASGLLGAVGFMIRNNGHLFYVLQTFIKTLVYDVYENLWSEWTGNSSGSHINFIVNSSVADTGGNVLLQDSQHLYKFSDTTYLDNGVAIICDVYTRQFDFETMSRKFMPTLYLVGDQPTTTTNVTVRWSDNDYNTWNTGRTIDISKRPYLTRLGSFRRRAFNLKCTENVPLRWEALEFSDLQTGNN